MDETYLIPVLVTQGPSHPGRPERLSDRCSVDPADPGVTLSSTDPQTFLCSGAHSVWLLLGDVAGFLMNILFSNCVYTELLKMVKI